MRTATPPVAPRLLLAAITAAVLCVSCGGASTDRHVGSRATSTTAATVPPTTGATVPAGGCTTPTLAARAVVTAWTASDRTGAGQCATPDAVATLFAHPGHGAGWTFQGCDGPDPGVPVCTFVYPGGVARLTLQGTEAAGWSVDQVQFGAA
ncbi:MAG TPA: hypothetical protein VLV81_05690 [Acidimicrobiia bacterium]|nr:hypothetical protein [Acidimicrobiia bacterium]